MINWNDCQLSIRKKENKNNPQNCRRIALRSTKSKTFTYLLNRRLGHWCDDNNILSEAQFTYNHTHLDMELWMLPLY